VVIAGWRLRSAPAALLRLSAVDAAAPSFALRIAGGVSAARAAHAVLRAAIVLLMPRLLRRPLSRAGVRWPRRPMNSQGWLLATAVAVKAATRSSMGRGMRSGLVPSWSRKGSSRTWSVLRATMRVRGWPRPPGTPVEQVLHAWRPAYLG